MVDPNIITVLLMNLRIPEDVRCNGVQDGGKRGDVLVFTDLIKDGPSHGHTFTLPVESADRAMFRRKLAAFRAKHKPEPARILPCHQRGPVQYVAPDQSHY